MSCPPPNPPPVVIDNGSWTIKSGFAGNETPKLETPSTDVIVAGSITNWETATQMWKDIISKLGTTVEKQHVLITEPILATVSEREKMFEIFFKVLNARSLFLAYQPVLSLYATGNLNGIVVEIGYGVLQVTPCFLGYAVSEASCRFDFAGQKLDEHLTTLLANDGITGLSIDTIRDIKEKHCYVALTYKNEEQRGDSIKKAYKLPNGKEIEIGKPLFACPEALFQPSMAGQSFPGIHSLVSDAIIKASAAKGAGVESFYNAVVIAGGSSQFPGLAKRLEKELTTIAPPGTNVKVRPAPGALSSFIGGCLLSCLPDMAPMWITREMYDKGTTTGPKRSP